MENVRKVQLIQLNILKIFIEICNKHNLSYYMIGGSLIGVLRHKGFIPWDDDIDIGMPRKDYEKFVALQSYFPEGYTLTNCKNDPNWQFNFSQFVDKESIIDIYMNEIPRRCHIWIDVFPIDGLPSNKLHRWIHMKRILLYRYLIQIPNIRTQVDTHKVGRPWYEKLAIKIIRILPLNSLINANSILEKMDYALKKYDFNKMEYAGNLLGKYREREVVPKSYWGTPLELPFENIMVKVPSNYHNLQTNLYGNYMQIPCKKYQVSHDIKIIKLREK